MKKNNIHIAIVDDGINEQYYTGCKLKYNIEIAKDLKIKQRELYDKNISSHGSICAAIIHKFAPKACISSVKILNKDRVTEIRRLIKAIEWCIDNEINMINLSLGTVYFNDFKKLTPIVKMAIRKGIVIVAASSNSGQITYPAYITDVIGVKCDLKNTLKEGEYRYNCFPNDGVNITANSDIIIHTALGNSKHTGLCNSYAAAFITSKVYNILSNNRDITLVDLNRIIVSDSINGNDKCYALMNIKKEIDWIQNAVLFQFNQNKSMKLGELQFNLIDTVCLEYKTQDKMIMDMKEYLGKPSGEISVIMIDTIIIDAMGLGLIAKDYCSNSIISELSMLNKNIVYLDDNEIDNKLVLNMVKNENNHIKIWHPYGSKLFNFTDYKKIDSSIPVITVHDMTNRYLCDTVSKLKTFFQKDGYNIIPIISHCYGKLYGFEFIPLYNEFFKSRSEDVLEFITNFYNPDIMLFGFCCTYHDIDIIDKTYEIDISIVITDHIDNDCIDFIKSSRVRKFIIIAPEESPEVLHMESDNIIQYDFSLLDHLYALYQYIICLYNEADE